MPTLTMFVGPPGSGKSTAAREYLKTHGNRTDLIYINQDSQGSEEHKQIFHKAINSAQDIVVDRMNFNRKQRDRYLDRARENNYFTRIVVLHVPKEECLKRCYARTGHETIKTKADAQNAIHFFFKSYERVEDDEANEVIRQGWKPRGSTKCIVCDLDGTMANIEHRLHFVRTTDSKPDWKSFFENMVYDKVNDWCDELISMMSDRYPIVYATGRPEEYLEHTKTWLQMHDLTPAGFKLFMREAGDYRADSIAKQNILDFEIKTRYDILFVVDDRQQVVDMWRKNGYTVLQCAKGDF